ncbi:MAG TPA: TIGR04086 family membrane protein [Mollicutes bacterium]|nr:TIGR04086 family membrane protein [Mollicutes bacterium]
MKMFLKGLIFTSVGLLGLTLILTVLHYFNLINDKAVEVIKLIISITSISVGGFVVGASCEKKGWLSGLKFAFIIILIFVLFTFIFRIGFNFKTFIYYLIIIASSTIGSMIGISTKINEK